MNWRTILAGTVVSAMLAGGAQAADPLKIGVLFPLTGPMALIGNEAYQAAEVARDIINERGGVFGRKVEYAVADAPDPKSANAEATRLIIREKVPLIAGSYASSLSLAASEVAEREGVMYWETVAVADKITRRNYKNIVRTTFNASMMGEAASNFAKELAGRLNKEPSALRVAVISEDSEFGQSVGDAAAARAKALGLNVVANERYSRTVTDLSSLVLKLKSTKPDVLIATSYLNDGVLFWRQARELDLNVSAMIGVGTGYALPDFLTATGKHAEGIFDIDAPITPNVAALPPATQKLYAEFLERFRAKTKRDPGPLALISFGGFYTLFNDVLPKAGSTKLDAVRTAAYGLDLPAGSLLTGAGIKLKPMGDADQGQNTRALPIVMQWQNDKLKVVWPKEAAGEEKISSVPLKKWSER